MRELKAEEVGFSVGWAEDDFGSTTSSWVYAAWHVFTARSSSIAGAMHDDERRELEEEALAKLNASVRETTALLACRMPFEEIAGLFAVACEVEARRWPGEYRDEMQRGTRIAAHLKDLWEFVEDVEEPYETRW